MATFKRKITGPQGIVLRIEYIPCKILEEIKSDGKFKISYYSQLKQKDIITRVNVDNVSYQYNEIPINSNIDMPVPYKD